MGCSDHICGIGCLCFLLVFFFPFVILLTLLHVGLEPRFYIHNLYVPALNISTNNNASNLNNSIFIDLKFKRVAALVPLRYEDLNITLFYASNRSFPVAHHVIPGFYQGNKMTAHRRAVVEASGLQPILGGSVVTLAVELATKYKLKRYDDDNDWHYTKPKTVVVAADVRLNSSGSKASKKPVRLH